MSVYIKLRPDLLAAQFKDFLKQRNWTEIKKLIQQNQSVKCLYNDLLASKYNKVKSDKDLQQLINELFIEYYFQNNIECFELVTQLGVTADPFIKILLQLAVKRSNITDDLIKSLIYNSEPDIEFTYSSKEAEDALIQREADRLQGISKPKETFIDWNYQDKHGVTLMMAAMPFSERLEDVILRNLKNVNMDLVNQNGLNLLMSAVIFCKSKKVFDAILSKDKSINFITKHGETALYLACRFNEVYKVKELLKAGADPNLGKNGFYPILVVISEEVLKELIKYNVNPNVEDSDNDTILYKALRSYSYLLPLLLSYQKTNVNYETTNGLTALIYCIYNFENINVELLLLDKRLNINYETRDGLTALIATVIYNNLEACKLLVNDKRTNINYKSKFGLTALEYAKRGQLKINGANNIKEIYALNHDDKDKINQLNFMIKDLTSEEAFERIQRVNATNSEIIKLLSK